MGATGAPAAHAPVRRILRRPQDPPTVRPDTTARPADHCRPTLDTSIRPGSSSLWHTSSSGEIARSGQGHERKIWSDGAPDRSR